MTFDNESTNETTMEQDTAEHVDHSSNDASEQGIDAQSSANGAAGDASETEFATAALQHEVTDLRNQLLRVQADFDNFRKRTRQEKEDLQRYATKTVLIDVLSVVDNFDRALTSLPDDDALGDVRKGVEMVHRQLLSVLEKHGVEALQSLGQSFDPNLHEAVMQEPAGDSEAGVIVMELQKGYTLHGKLLRPAMVKVTV